MCYFSSNLLKIDDDILNADCNLVCDGMSIKTSATYKKTTTGDSEGFVDLGNEIVPDDENEVATEALVFMLVSLRQRTGSIPLDTF